MNRADLSARAGRYQQQATRRKGPAVAGLEAAGEVVAVGQSVGLFACGDRVMGQCSGGFAELVAVDERILMPAPTSLGWLEAAATPVALVTGHDAIATGAGLVAGDSVLIQGAGSTVGMIAVQVSSKFLELDPLVVAAAQSQGWTGELATDGIISTWVVAARERARLVQPPLAEALTPVDTAGVHPWTDDFIDLLRALPR